MLFDTTFLIDYEREVKCKRAAAVHAFLTKHPTVPLYISIISVGEFAEAFDAGHSRTRTITDWELAWQAYKRGGADAAGIVDNVSLVVMRRLGSGTDTALSFE